MSYWDDVDGHDPPLTPEQQAAVNALSETQVKAIDEALWAVVSQQWRKMARIVGTTMMNLEGQVADIPDVYYANRVRHFISSGAVEVQGDPSRMRYCEVRLPQGHRK